MEDTSTFENITQWLFQFVKKYTFGDINHIVKVISFDMKVFCRA